MQEQSTRQPPGPSSSDIISSLPSLDRGNSRRDLKALLEMLQNNDRIVLSNGKYSKEDIEELLQHPEASFQRTTHLWLHWNHHPPIASQLQGHAFPNLRVLNIGGNHVSSIELLQSCDFSKLQELWLWNNELTHLNSLRKCRLPNLLTLDISYNRINEWSKISELQAPKLQLVNLERNCFTSLSDFVKTMLRSNKFSILFMQNKIVSSFGSAMRKGKKTFNEASYSCKGKAFLKYN